MLSMELQSQVEKATVKITKEGGQGVLVCGNLIITAAHCIEYSLEGTMIADAGDMNNPERYFYEIETYDGNRFRVEPLAVEPVSDIAILQPLTHHDLYEETEQFEHFCEKTKSLPLFLEEFEVYEEFPVSVFTHKGTWLTGKGIAGTRNSPSMSVHLDNNQLFELGTSGSAVVNDRGEIVGIISIGGGNRMSCTRPNMALPVWIHRRYFMEEPEFTEKYMEQMKKRTKNILKDYQQKE